jgi:hypothetical protein
MKYTISSYSKEPLTDFLGHVGFTETTDSLDKAKKIAKEKYDQGDIRVTVTEGDELVFRYADISYG